MYNFKMQDISPKLQKLQLCEHIVQLVKEVLFNDYKIHETSQLKFNGIFMIKAFCLRYVLKTFLGRISSIFT